MGTLIKYELKIMLALAAVMCYAASSMDYFWPMASVILRILGFAFTVWAIIEPAREEADDEY